MKISRGLTGAILLLLALCFWFGCDDDPVSPRTELVDYPIYLINSVNGTIFIYHPVSRILDSVPTPFARHSKIMITEDGTRLYLTGDDQTVVLETNSFTTVSTIPYGARSSAALSPDGSMLALSGPDLRILYTSDKSLRFYDTNFWPTHSIFTADSRTFYATTRYIPGRDGTLYAVLFGESPGQARFLYYDSLKPDMVVPTPDGRKLLMILNGQFRMYDLRGDTLMTMGDFGWAANNSIAVTPDSRFATFGNGAYGIGFPRYSPLYIHDVILCTIVDSIDLSVVEDSLGTYPAGGIGSSVVTPDGRWLIALNGAFPAQLYLFDLKSRELVDFIELGDNHWLGGPVVPNLSR